VLRLQGCYENWLKRRSGAYPLCWVAEALRSAAATGKPLAVSWAVVAGVGAFGGVVAWKVALFVDYGGSREAWSAASLRGAECRCRPRWSALGSWWGLVRSFVGVLLAGAEECGGEEWWYCWTSFFLLLLLVAAYDVY